ncbi:MAG: hypothetical protein A2X77_02945 [Gammaproteobacteria bacterium GWE2_42_36]|nr:MAG: hypothetical protein A2X77_02945 [Gammaproteobacteria bacterium GWE2_42_36]
MKYHHILVATDFSDDSGLVMKKAQELAKQMGAKLSVTHVVEPLPGYGYAFIASSDIEIQLVDESKKQLAHIGKTYHISPENQHIGLGPTKVEINRLAEELKVDLIVLGSHGRQGWALLLGSTANAVLNSAPCDVLVVRIKK